MSTSTTDFYPLNKVRHSLHIHLFIKGMKCFTCSLPTVSNHKISLFKFCCDWHLTIRKCSENCSEKQHPIWGILTWKSFTRATFDFFECVLLCTCCMVPNFLFDSFYPCCSTYILLRWIRWTDLILLLFLFLCFLCFFFFFLVYSDPNTNIRSNLVYSDPIEIYI